MPFKLFELLERFMKGAFLINSTQVEKTGSNVEFLFLWEIFQKNSTFEIVHVFSRHFHVRLWRVLFTSLSADGFQLNAKSACIRKCINILKLFPEKKKQKQKKSSRPI